MATLLFLFALPAGSISGREAVERPDIWQGWQRVPDEHGFRDRNRDIEPDRDQQRRIAKACEGRRDTGAFAPETERVCVIIVDSP